MRGLFTSYTATRLARSTPTNACPCRNAVHDRDVVVLLQRDGHLVAAVDADVLRLRAGRRDLRDAGQFDLAQPPRGRSTTDQVDDRQVPRRQLGDLAFVDVLVAFVLDRDGRLPAILGDVDRVRLTTQVVRCYDRTSAQVDDHQHPDGSACDFEVLTTSLPSAVAAAISAAVCSAAELFRSTGIVSNRWSRADTDAVAGAAEKINTKATRPVHDRTTGPTQLGGAQCG